MFWHMSCVFSTTVCSDTFLQQFLAQGSSRLLANEEILWDEKSRIKCVILCFLLFFLSFLFSLGFMRQHSKNNSRRDRRWPWKATITTFGIKLLSKFPLHFCQLKVHDEAFLAAFGWQTLLRDDILLSISVAICWWLLVVLTIAGSTKIDSTCPGHISAGYGLMAKRILPEKFLDRASGAGLTCTLPHVDLYGPPLVWLSVLLSSVVHTGRLCSLVTVPGRLSTCPCRNWKCALKCFLI